MAARQSLAALMKRLHSIQVPQRLQRNAPRMVAAGVEHTGEVLLNSLAMRIGRRDLGGLDILDLGCGVRFTQTLINKNLPFKSYTGIDVSLPRIQWLKDNVENKDDRFSFTHWNVRNALYNSGAPLMQEHAVFPVPGDYDLLMGFSLFTHLNPDDAKHMLMLARNGVRPGGWLFFSAFCDEGIAEFEDRVPDRPLLKAYYNPKYLRGLIQEAHWAIVSYQKRGTYIMDSFLCRPVHKTT